MSAVLGGVRKGMETISSEAANVIQRVAGNSSKDTDVEQDSPRAGQVRYSPAPELPGASNSTGLLNSAMFGPEQPRGVSQGPPGYA
jgi:hypothetical protein